MNQFANLPHPLTTPLPEINVSDPRLYQQDAWRPYFQRLRDEDPVHYLADSAFGPFWSVTRFEDIVAVDSNYEDFSSEPTIVIGIEVDESFDAARAHVADVDADGRHIRFLLTRNRSVRVRVRAGKIQIRGVGKRPVRIEHEISVAG